MKHLNYLIPVLLFLSCVQEMDTSSSPIIEVRLSPTYVPYNVHYESYSPTFLIKKDRSVFINQNGEYFSGKLSENELDGFQDTLTSIGFFDLDKEVIKRFNINQRDGFGMHGTLVTVINRFANNTDTIKFAKYIDSFEEDEECYYEEFYCSLVNTLSSFDKLVSQFEFDNMEAYEGPLALSFVTDYDSNNKKVLEWPFETIIPKTDSLYNTNNEVYISEKKMLEALREKRIELYQPYWFQNDTFQVFSRPIFK